MAVLHIPNRGDVFWVKFDPQAGSEIMKTRPAVIVSRYNFNRITRFAVVCPITSEIKGHLFEVKIPDGFPVAGAIRVDQVKSIDWIARCAGKKICTLPDGHQSCG